MYTLADAKRSSLVARIAVAAARMDEHCRGCYACHAARRDTTPRQYCDHGWELAKDLQKARHEYRTWRDRPPAHTQTAMF